MSNIDRRKFLTGSATAVGAMVIRGARALADVPRHFTWQQGLKFLMKEGEKKAERSDDFFIFENGASTWTDTKPLERNWSVIIKGTPDWAHVEGLVAKEGKIFRQIHIHTHHPGLRRGKKVANVPSPVDIRSAAAMGSILSDDRQHRLVTPRHLRAFDYTSEDMVLDTGTKSAWRFAWFPNEVVRRYFPDVREVDIYSGERKQHEKEVADAQDHFAEVSANFAGDVARMRSDGGIGEAAYKRLMVACANVGVLMRYVSPEELQKEGPLRGIIRE